MWALTGSQALEFTAGADLAGKLVGLSFPSLNAMLSRGQDVKSKLHTCTTFLQKALGQCVRISADHYWALGKLAERLGTGKGQILKSSRVGENAG